MNKNSTPDIKAWITRAIEFITTDIWRVRLEDLPFGKSFLIKQLRIIILTLRGFDEDDTHHRLIYRLRYYERADS